MAKRAMSAMDGCKRYALHDHSQNAAALTGQANANAYDGLRDLTGNNEAYTFDSDEGEISCPDTRGYCLTGS